MTLRLNLPAFKYVHHTPIPGQHEAESLDVSWQVSRTHAQLTRQMQDGQPPFLHCELQLNPETSW
jgi:hypothetical protein